MHKIVRMLSDILLQCEPYLGKYAPVQPLEPFSNIKCGPIVGVLRGEIGFLSA